MKKVVVVILVICVILFTTKSVRNKKSTEKKYNSIVYENDNEIKKEDNTTINFIYENEIKELKLEKNKITYNNEAKNLASKNATYDLCPIYEYTEVDDNYYLIKISIPVLINNENTTANDDIILTYIGLKKEDNNYPINYICS